MYLTSSFQVLSTYVTGILTALYEGHSLKHNVHCVEQNSLPQYIGGLVLLIVLRVVTSSWHSTYIIHQESGEGVGEWRSKRGGNEPPIGAPKFELTPTAQAAASSSLL